MGRFYKTLHKVIRWDGPVEIRGRKYGDSRQVSSRFSSQSKTTGTFRLFSARQRPVPLRRSAQLFTDNAPKRFLERLIRAFHVPAQTFVDERLIVASARAFHLVAEPLQNLIVQANGDARLPARRDDFELVVFGGG